MKESFSHILEFGGHLAGHQVSDCDGGLDGHALASGDGGGQGKGWLIADNVNVKDSRQKTKTVTVGVGSVARVEAESILTIEPHLTSPSQVVGV